MDSDTAILAEDLGKQYRVGHLHRPQATLKETLAGVLRRPGGGHAGQSFWALRHVSFRVRRGQALGVIGRNGSGKSTLLKILARTISPTEGYAEFRGRAAPLLEVGTGFNPELTGRENIFLNGAILGMKRTEIQRRFNQIVDFAEIGPFLDTPVKHYSSGMYVRLAFSVAAHLEPEILIADEVLAVGDMAFQQKCLGRMNDAARDGRTVVLVSHNATAVADLCDHVLYLERGAVRAYGPPKEVLEAYNRDLAANPTLTAPAFATQEPATATR